jgi:hypothetical protein
MVIHSAHLSNGTSTWCTCQMALAHVRMVHAGCGRQLRVARLPVGVRSNHRRSLRGRSVSRLTGPSGCIWCNRAAARARTYAGDAITGGLDGDSRGREVQRRLRQWSAGSTAASRSRQRFRNRRRPPLDLAFPPPPGPVQASTVRSPSPPNPSQAQAFFSPGPSAPWCGPTLSESYPLHSRAALV